ncbi:hypothetical protein FRC20_011018 [Serendipita sp. 405]|nr:hypothetical protein FRC15_005320 [Serendipita sp. 397]KAG8862855.1 hypothetical protein FRC20_011018 [Serendipita sp. 405]
MTSRKSRPSRVHEQNQIVSEQVTPVRKPRASIFYAHSPTSTPSLSASLPFDWEAARGHRPPPYPTPNDHSRSSRRMRTSMGVGVGVGTDETMVDGSTSTVHLANGALRKPRKSRVFIRTSWGAWLLGLPSQWWLRIEMMRHDIPLPPPKILGRIIGISLHVAHAYVKWSDLHQAKVMEDGWEALGLPIYDEYGAEEEQVWITWSMILHASLLTLAIANTLRMLTRTRIYDFQLRGEFSQPIASVNASFIPSPVKRGTFQSKQASDPTILSRLFRLFLMFGRWIAHAWRFLLHHPSSARSIEREDGPKIQRVEMWDPSQRELVLFQTYSPLHAMLWYIIQSNNWMIMCCIMAMTSFQLGIVVKSYSHLVKDRQIVDAEVLNEYQQRFVNPRLNVVKKDACVMTHEAEMIHYRDVR